MSFHPDPLSPADAFLFDARSLTRSAINGARAVFGIFGAISLLLGICLLVWPEKSLAVAATVLGIYIVLAGVIRLGVGIFASGIPSGHRVLDLLLGLLYLIGGVIMLKNTALAAATLMLVVVVVIGIGWIAEGIIAIAESRHAESRGWAIALGGISVLAGIAVLAVPNWTAVVLIYFTGAVLVILGIVGIVRAFTFGREVLQTLDTTAP